jgi:hypothetical protein
MACTGLDFEVFSRVNGATPVECSDENWRFQKARRQIGGIAKKPLRHRLGNFSFMQSLCCGSNSNHADDIHFSMDGNDCAMM